MEPVGVTLNRQIEELEDLVRHKTANFAKLSGELESQRRLTDEAASTKHKIEASIQNLSRQLKSLVEVSQIHLNGESRAKCDQDNDVEIDAIVKPYDLGSISMSGGDLMMGDLEFICVDKDVRLPFGQLRQLPADPATNDQLVYGTLVYQIKKFARDGTQALWVITGRRAGGGA